VGVRDVRLRRWYVVGRVRGVPSAVERGAARTFTLPRLALDANRADNERAVYERNPVKLRLFVIACIVFVVCAALASVHGGWSWDEGGADATAHVA
jgi:hypothetical protein